MAQAAVMLRARPDEQQQYTPLGKPPLSPQPLDSSLITSTVRKRKVATVDPCTDTPHPQRSAPLAPEDGKRQRTPPVDRGLATRSGGDDAVVHLLVSPGLQAKAAAAAAATPVARFPPLCEDERPQQPGPWQHQAAAQHQHQQHGGSGVHHAPPRQQGQEEEVLFSPLFHLHREGSNVELCSGASEAAVADAAAAAAQCAAAGATLAAAPPLPVATAGGLAPISTLGSPAPPLHRTDTTEATSTDHSTGTSASLAMDADLAGCTDAELAESSADQEGCEDEELNNRGGGRGCTLAAAPVAHPPPPAEDEEYLEFDPLLFIKRLPPLERCVPPRRDFLLPKRTRRSKQKTLVLDLDETLVHSTLDGYCRPDFTFPVEVGSMRHMVSVRQRPHLHTFLERAAQLYEVVVFTASQRVYAEQLLDIVDPERRLVRHRVYRESCVFWEGNYLKDLTVLGRDLAHTIIVDNSPQAFGFQLDNGIPIESWYDDDADEELLKLIPFLEKVAHTEDVRPHIQKRYRLRSLVDAAADPEAQYLLQQQAATAAQQQQEQARQRTPPPEQ